MDTAKPTIRQLEYFIAVAEVSSFRRAAERLGVSQPTLTAQVAKLEDTLGVSLFERSRRGAHLTPMGRELLNPARRVLEETNGLMDVATVASQKPGGTYRLGVTPTSGPYVLPHVLPDLHHHYDTLRYYVREDAPMQLEAGLREGRHDLILTPLPLASKEFTVTPLFRERLKLVVPTGHQLALRDTVTAADLRNLDVLTIEERHLLHRQVRELCDRFDARLLRDYEGTSLDALRQMVTMGMGVAFLPALYIHSEIRPLSGLHVCEFKDERIDRLHALSWRPSSPSRAVFRQMERALRGILYNRLGHVIDVIAE